MALTILIACSMAKLFRIPLILFFVLMYCRQASASDPPIVFTSPADDTAYSTVSITYTLNPVGPIIAGSVQLQFEGISNDHVHIRTTLTFTDSASQDVEFYIDPTSLMAGPVTTISPTTTSIPEGIYTVTLSFSDNNGLHQSTAAGVRLDYASDAPYVIAPTTESTSSVLHISYLLAEEPLEESVVFTLTPETGDPLLFYMSDDMNVDFTWDANATTIGSLSGTTYVTSIGTSDDWPAETINDMYLPEGTYTATLSYRDALSNPTAMLSATEFHFVRPHLVIHDVTVDAQEKHALVQVDLSNHAWEDTALTVDYATADGTAIAGEHFDSVSGTLTWNGYGSGSKIISIPIHAAESTGDDISFTLSLSDASRAVIDDADAIITITGLADAIAPALDNTASNGAGDARGNGVFAGCASVSQNNTSLIFIIMLALALRFKRRWMSLFQSHTGALLLMFMLTRASSAQASGTDLHRYTPADAGSRWLSAESLVANHALFAPFDVSKIASTLVLRFDTDYGRTPLVLTSSSGDKIGNAVGNQLTGTLQASVYLSPALRVGLALPLQLFANGDTIAAGSTSLHTPAHAVALGDMRLSTVYRLDTRYGEALRLGVGTNVRLPTGSTASYSGAGTPSVTFFGCAAGDYKALAWSASLGTRVRNTQNFSDYRVGSELQSTLAAGYQLLDRHLLIGLEVPIVSSLAADKPLDGKNFSVDPMAGAHWWPSAHWGIHAGLGTSLTRALGAVQWRGVVAVEYWFANMY